MKQAASSTTRAAQRQVFEQFYPMRLPRGCGYTQIVMRRFASRIFLVSYSAVTHSLQFSILLACLLGCSMPSRIVTRHIDENKTQFLDIDSDGRLDCEIAWVVSATNFPVEPPIATPIYRTCKIASLNNLTFLVAPDGDTPFFKEGVALSDSLFALFKWSAFATLYSSEMFKNSSYIWANGRPAFLVFNINYGQIGWLHLQVDSAGAVRIDSIAYQANRSFTLMTGQSH